jgi:hypothetical protein
MVICKPSGLDSRDRSRSRSRMSFASRLTFFKCQDLLDSWDRIFFSRSRFLKSRLFQSRLGRVEIFVEIVKTYWDCRDLSRFVETQRVFSRFVKTQRFLDILETFWGTSGPKNLTNREISTEKYDKIDQLSIEIETNCQETPKFSDLDEFSISIETFWSGHWCRDEIQEFSISTEIFSIVETNIFKVSRSPFFCLNRDSRSRHDRDKSRPPGLVIWFQIRHGDYFASSAIRNW